MASVSTYLNFPGTTEQAFEFYRSVFGGEFVGQVIRFGDQPMDPNTPPLPDAVRDQILHIELALPGGHIIMATDAPAELGMECTPGNNMHINLALDDRAALDTTFAALSADGSVSMEPAEMFWGDYFCSFTDRFGINWMLGVPLG